MFRYSTIYPFVFTLNIFLKITNIKVLYRMGHAIGDQLLMTGYALKLKESSKKVIIFTRYQDLFKNHTFTTLSPKNKFILKAMNYIMRNYSFSNILHFSIDKNDYQNFMRIDGNRSLLDLMQVHTWNLPTKRKLRDTPPSIIFSESEIENFNSKFADLPNGFVVISTESKVSHTPNKAWNFDNFQEVVNNLRSVTVQIGTSNSERLDNVIDLCGTTNLRELCYIISKSQFVIATEGLINHIAAAFDVKSFVILTGYQYPEIVEYKRSYFISNNNDYSCAPCWKTETCPVEGFPCSNSITSEQVIEFIKKHIGVNA